MREQDLRFDARTWIQTTIELEGWLGNQLKPCPPTESGLIPRAGAVTEVRPRCVQSIVKLMVLRECHPVYASCYLLLL